MQKELGQYRILERLGSGAMGEVYLAQDTKLGRRVAIKMLPPEVAGSPERRKHLEREAQVVAALNHPNIVTVHSVEETDGLHFITMELVEGTTLTSLLSSMTQKRFLDVAIPLADAIGTAHRQGMIHRDLKPENIMVTDEGRPKVLDFGLAKLTEGLGETSISELATRAKTEEGLIVGTIAYMSPEQAEGKSTDERADIFALGIIFYEMLAKRHPFPGETAAAILSSILRETPASLDEIDSRIPHDLARIVRRCLEKEPGRRYQNAIDLRNDLEEVQQGISSGALSARIERPSEAGWKKLVPWSLVAVLAALALIPRGGDAPEPPVRRHVFQPPSSTPAQGRPWLAPDGSHLYFHSARDGERALYVQPLDELTPRLVPGTEGFTSKLAFSPDGEWFVFEDRGSATLRKMPMNGGEPLILCDAFTLLGADWGDDGNVVFGLLNKGLSRVSAEGGLAEDLFETNEEDGDLDAHDPDVLPGSHAVLYTLHQLDGGERIEAYILETGERKVLVEDARQPRYAPTGPHRLRHCVDERAFRRAVRPRSRRDHRSSGPGARKCTHNGQRPGNDLYDRVRWNAGLRARALVGRSSSGLGRQPRQRGTTRHRTASLYAPPAVTRWNAVGSGDSRRRESGHLGLRSRDRHASTDYVGPRQPGTRLDIRRRQDRVCVASRRRRAQFVLEACGRKRRDGASPGE